MKNNLLKFILLLSFIFVSLTLKGQADFKGGFEDSKVILQWSLAFKSDVIFFNIEKSSDGNIFNQLGTVDLMDYSTVKNKFEFQDFHPEQGNNYYKLLGINEKNQVVYSVIIAVYCNLKELPLDFILYPNPFESIINLLFNRLCEEQISISISNLKGKIIHKQKYDISQSKKLGLNLRGKPKGIYIVSVHTKHSDIKKKIILNK